MSLAATAMWWNPMRQASRRARPVGDPTGTFRPVSRGPVNERREARGGLATVAIAVLALVGAGVAAYLLPTPEGRLTGEPAAQSFLDAWERSRLGTYVVESTFRREHPDGSFSASTRIVQRPPDRLSIGLGGVEGTLDGHILRCATDTSGDFECFDGPEAGDYREQVDKEIENLEGAVRGSRPLYLVESDGPGCFRLVLALAFPSPPYGDSARFCFDDDTGATVLIEIRRGDAVDTTTAISVRSEVTEADLEVPEGAGPLPEPEN
jgi:hypothetical protein